MTQLTNQIEAFDADRVVHRVHFLQANTHSSKPDQRTSQTSTLWASFRALGMREGSICDSFVTAASPDTLTLSNSAKRDEF